MADAQKVVLLLLHFDFWCGVLGRAGPRLWLQTETSNLKLFLSLRVEGLELLFEGRGLSIDTVAARIP